MVLSPIEISTIKTIQQSIMNKLSQAIEGTADFEEGNIKNPQAPCLIRSAMYDLISLLRVINLAEEKA